MAWTVSRVTSSYRRDISKCRVHHGWLLCRSIFAFICHHVKEMRDRFLPSYFTSKASRSCIPSFGDDFDKRLKNPCQAPVSHAHTIAWKGYRIRHQCNPLRMFGFRLTAEGIPIPRHVLEALGGPRGSSCRKSSKGSQTLSLVRI